MLLSFPRSASSSVCTGVPLVCCAARGFAPTRWLTTRPLGTAGMCAYVFALRRWLCLSLHRTGCRTRCDGRLAQTSRCCSLCHRKTGTGTPSSLSRRIHLWPETGYHNACGDLLGQNAHCCWRQPHKTGTCSGMCRPCSLGDRTREATCAAQTAKPLTLSPLVDRPFFTDLLLPHNFGRPGSAAGAAALKSGDAVRWWWLSIALATRGRAGAADPPLKSFSLVGFSRFSGSGVDKKRVKFQDAFWRS